MNEALQVGFNPVPAAERVARWHAMIRARLIALGLVAAAAVALWFLRRDWLGEFWYLVAVAVVVTVGWIIGAAVLWFLAKRDVVRLGEGVALVLDRRGIAVRETQVPWERLKAFTTKATSPWRSTLLVVESLDGERLLLPLDYLDRTPGELDNAARAYSAGRFGLDMAGVGV